MPEPISMLIGGAILKACGAGKVLTVVKLAITGKKIAAAGTVLKSCAMEKGIREIGSAIMDNTEISNDLEINNEYPAYNYEMQYLYQNFNQSPSYNYYSYPLFNYESIAAGQEYGDCAIHAIGNIAQIANPNLSEDYVYNTILNSEEIDNGIRHSSNLDKHNTLKHVFHYERILEESFDIECHWEKLEGDNLLKYIGKNHKVVAIGRAMDIYPNLTDPKASHVWTIVDAFINDDSQIMYGILDSNRPNTVNYLPSDQIEKSIKNCPRIGNDNNGFRGEFLVTNHSIPNYFRKAQNF